MKADVYPLRTQAELALADVFAATKATLPGTESVAARRAEAFAHFAAKGLPHRRIEAWKYTDLRALMRDLYPVAPVPDSAAKQRAQGGGQILAGLDCRRLVMVDGAFAPDLSDLVNLEPGLSIDAMAAALAKGDPVVTEHLGKTVAADDPTVALNTALMGDGLVIRVAAGAAIERPLYLVMVTTGEAPAAMFTRSLMVVEPGAHLTLVESHEGPGQSPYQVNTAFELVVGDDAAVEHIKITREGSAALHVATLLASIGARATFNDFRFTIGGATVRDQLFVRCAGEGADFGLRGASLLAGKQHTDTTLFVDHAAVGGQSRELFKSVLTDESHSVFQGKITVRPGAQKTDARMMARALLLSDEAEVSSKPELEIFADDVQCGHGSTAGGLDEALKFYLMARGIPAKEVEALLVQAFVGEAIDAVGHAGIRDALMDATVGWLRERE